MIGFKFLSGFVFLMILSVNASEISDEVWSEMKSKAVHRNRKIIFNNDGCDALYYPRKLAATEENFIQQRMVNAADSAVDTYSYCPVSSGFGYLTCRTQIGDRLLVDPPHAKSKRNVTAELFEQGTDPVEIAEKFCHENGLEFFITLRCNDTHDMSHTKEKPYFLFPPYKGKHPELLMGSYNNRPPHCSWSAVDFTQEEIRSRFVAIAKEMIRNYNLDGLELDFCRHLQYFKSVAWGAEASQIERELLTGCIREIRDVAEKTGRERKQPILLSIRVPDSAGLCKAVGIDLEEWMSEGLVDIVIGGFYMQLNPWKEMVDLCHQYNVQFYPSLDESRIRKVEAGFNRNTPKADRAQVAAALNAGADGIYYFNRYGPTQLRNVRGSLEDIQGEDKSYFVTYRYRSPSEYLATGESYNQIKNLSPKTPGIISPGVPLDYDVDFGEDLSLPEVSKLEPTITVFAVINGPGGDRLQIQVNGTPLQPLKARGNLATYSAAADLFKPGLNQVTVSASPSENSLKFETIIMSGEMLLTGRNQSLWRRLFSVHDFEHSEKIIDGAYRISDTGTGEKEMANLLYPLHAVGEELVVRFEAKVKHASDPLSAVFRVADGRNIEIITLQPDKIGLHFSGQSVPFNTTDAFHQYEARMKDGQLVLTVDGQELFNAPLTLRADNAEGYLKDTAYRIANMNRQSLLFGSLSGPGTGAVFWKNVRFVETNESLQLDDLRVDVHFPKAGHLKKYRSVSPDWTFRFDVGGGELPASSNVKIHYDRSNMQIVDGDQDAKALRLTHLEEGFQTIMIDDPALSEQGSGVVLAEWKMNYLQDVDGKGGFQVVFKPLNAKDQGLLCVLKFFEDMVVAPWGAVQLDSSIKNRWVTFRTAIDVEKEIAALWLNGEKISEGEVPVRLQMAPGIFIGDGSGSVAGQVELEYLYITTSN